MERPTLQVLLVDDEESKISQWNDAVDSFNADADNHGFQIEKLSAKSIQQARIALAMRKLDAVVVDLRLQNEVGVGEDNDDGNTLIRELVRTRPIGIVVYTGQSSQADLDSFPQVQVLDKGNGLQQVFTWLSEKKDLFVSLRSINMTFERETAKIFFGSIWPRWERWATQSSGSQLSHALARHAIAHVHDSLLYATGGEAHPEEAYFVPPLKVRLDTGDLVRRDNSVWIVVTPRCDLANEGKVVSVLLAKCEDIAGRWNTVEAKGQKKFARHEDSPKQHFLPLAFDSAGNQLGPWLIQFHHLDVVELQAARRDLTLPSVRFASLAPQYVPSLVERFGAYFSRIGTPNLSIE